MSACICGAVLVPQVSLIWPQASNVVLMLTTKHVFAIQMHSKWLEMLWYCCCFPSIPDWVVTSSCLSYHPFTGDFPCADIHELRSPDILHQVVKGTFKDHLVTWIGSYFANNYPPKDAKKYMDTIDRWWVLDLVSLVIQQIFILCSIAIVPTFAGLHRFPQGCNFKTMDRKWFKSTHESQSHPFHWLICYPLLMMCMPPRFTSLLWEVLYLKTWSMPSIHSLNVSISYNKILKMRTPWPDLMLHLKNSRNIKRYFLRRALRRMMSPPLTNTCLSITHMMSAYLGHSMADVLP